MEETNQNLGKWKCNTCGETEGVINGICATCGPTQTMPIDKDAEKIAGVAEAEEAKEKSEEERLKAEEQAK